MSVARMLQACGRPALLLAVSALFLGLAAALMSAPTFTPLYPKAVFWEQFTEDWPSRWSTSEAKKIIPVEKKLQESDEPQPEHHEFQFNGVWAVEEPSVFRGIIGDKGLVVKSPATHHAIAAPFNATLDPKGKTLVVQYEVKFQNLLECGGAYLKVLTKSSKPFEAKKFDDKTPYTIMFGPDKCGATNKVHFIFRHKNPLTGEYEEKHLKTAPPATISKLSSLYTLIVRPDNTFSILINNEKVSSGSLLEDFFPPVNPPKEIDDITDVKPANWVDEPKIADPKATKPADWDEDAPMQIEDLDAKKPDNWYENEQPFVNDPKAVKPADWNDEEDGTWQPNQIPNPKCATAAGCGPWKRPMKTNPDYKGKWFPSLIDNPDYVGEWKPRKIPNPDYFEDLTPANLELMSAIGFELWTIQADILFDNIYVGHSEEDAKDIASKTWAVKYAVEKALQEEHDQVKKAEDEEKDASSSSKHRHAFKGESLLEDVLSYVLELVEDLQDDPQAALKKHATVLGAVLIGSFFFLLLLKRVLFGGGARVASSAAAAAAAGAVKTAAEKTVDVGKKKKLDLSDPDAKAAKEASKENNPKASNTSTNAASSGSSTTTTTSTATPVGGLDASSMKNRAK